MLSNFGNILMLAFGFGFVIFWHELGHFLAAKWAGVKVEQFAVGFGQAVICWRKGLGFTWGTSQDAYLSKVKGHIEAKHATQLQLKELIAPTEAQLATAAAEIGISETEYRLNWIPLGGYVKMMGQDDLKPGQTVSDPRSYNNKTIGQRMVIVSAGVIMNIILAAILFMYIFTAGFKVDRPTVGTVMPGSPAEKAYAIAPDGTHKTVGLKVGDTVLTLNGREMSDFGKIKLNSLLLIAGDTVPMQVQHADGHQETLYVTPAKPSADSQFPLIGIGEYQVLKAPPAPVTEVKTVEKDDSSLLDEYTLIKPGDVITAVDGMPVGEKDYKTLDARMQTAGSNGVKVNVKGADGTPHQVTLLPHFVEPFGEVPLNFAGMQLPVRVDVIQAKSPLLKKVLPGDVIAAVADPSPSGGQVWYPTRAEMTRIFNGAGEHGVTLKLTVQRKGQLLDPIDAKPSVKLANGKFGYNIAPDFDEMTPIIAGVLPDSPAKAAKVRPGSTLTAINDKPVHNWFDVNSIMSGLKPDQPIKISATYLGEPATYTLDKLTQSQIDEIRDNRLISYAAMDLMPDEWIRKASSPWVAAEWGLGETRDAILQVYQTVRSMARGSISPKEVSGPVGILSAGYKIAERGTTQLIWFLAIISANLAVMNFLPIPIVDGGLFTFLIIEKLKGSPISQRTQSIAQAVGLVLLLSVFVFATYQDVARLPLMFK